MTIAPDTSAAPATTGAARRRIGIGLIGFGWLGQAHSRSMLRIPTLFPSAPSTPSWSSAATPSRRASTRRSARSATRAGRPTGARSWTTPRSTSSSSPRRTCCTSSSSRPPRRPASTSSARSRWAARPSRPSAPSGPRAHAGVITGVGYNYRWAPLVLYARQLIADGRLGRDHQLPRALLLDVRQRPARAAVVALPRRRGRPRGDQRPAQPRGRPRAHAARPDHAAWWARRRPSSPSARWRCRGQGHYGRGAPEDPRGAVTNEDYAGMLCEFASGARGTFEASRTIVGPESQNAFDVYGTKGALGWNLEQLNELALYVADDELHTGYRTVFGGDRFPYHGAFVPGSANSIGFEDLVAIEDFEFCRAIAEGRPFTPGFAEAVDWVSRPGGAAALGAVGALGGRRLPAGAVMRGTQSQPGVQAPGTATRPLRIGVIGVGRIGRMHAELLARQVPGAALAMVHDVTAAAADAAGAELGVAVAASADELLRSPRRRRGRHLLVDRHPRRPARRRGPRRQGDRSARSRSRWTWPRSTARWPPSTRPAIAVQIGFNRRFDPAHAVRGAGGGRRDDRRRAPRAHLQPRPRAAAAGVRARVGRDLPGHDDPRLRHGPLRDGQRGRRGLRVRRACASSRRSPRPATWTPPWSRSTHANGCLTVIDNSRQAVYGYDQRVEAFGRTGMAASENPLAHTGDRAHRAGHERARAAALLPGSLRAQLPARVGRVRRRGTRRRDAAGHRPRTRARRW